MSKQLKIYTKIGFLVVLCLNGCAPSSVISLRHSPSDVVLTSVNPVNTEVEYEIRSNIEDPYSYKNTAGYEFIIPINTPYRSNITSFLSTKYMNVSTSKSNAPLKILFELTSFEVEYENIQNFSDVLSGSGDANVIAKIASNIAVFNQGELIGERTISSDSRANERIRSSTRVEDVYQQAANDVLNTHTIMINNFIRSLED